MVELNYSASVEPEALPGRAYPRLPGPDPAAYGGQVGSSIEQASGVLQGVQDKIHAQAMQTQHTDAVNKLTVLADAATHTPQTGAFAQYGQNAFGLDQKYLPQFDQQAQSIIEAVPDPRARVAAQQSYQQIRTQLQNQLNTHELQQHKEFGIKTDQDAIDIASVRGPQNYNDAAILSSSLQTIGLKAQHLGDQLGWSPEQVEQFTQQQTSKFHMNVIERMSADGKFAMADHYLDTTKNQMDANTAWSARRMIDGQMKEKQNEAKQDIADRFQDSMTAAQYGLPNPRSVSRAELDILYPKDAQRHWDALNGMIVAGSTAQQMDKMTPEEAAAKRDSMYPTTGGPETANKIKAYEIVASAYDQSMKSRTADPAQFAIENHAWKPLDLTNPQAAIQNLKSRANTQEQVSEQMGVNAPLLSKPETKQFTAFLDSQKPSDRLQVLAGLRSTLPNDQAYAALLKQVAPGSPVTAIAGSMLDRPPEKATPTWYDPKFATDPTVPQRMLEGEEILRAKDEKGIASKFPMPSDKDLQGAFQSVVGGANSDLFRGRPDTLEAMYAAYKASYAAEASHQGVTNGVINSAIAQKAAQGVVGHATSYGPSTLVVPTGMDPARFEGVIDRASQSALQAAGYSDSDIKALAGHGLRELGDTLGTGRYVIIDGNGDPLKSKSGRNSVIVDLNRIRTQHASSNPESEEPVSGGPNFEGNLGK
jgi:hypothetical protein